ncbi:hypothetical protein BN2475_240018 [Paraburkholderia ribeironis]|uniref:Transposase IS701-like DDE domain-containing protein n=1 Tax=Paraburkholderia ribeironis TaxID=1247936 RepID=A0A1N7RXY2_9BURK|nr:hypothetical protein BN2475_240018 [Paraburkholderia ribeironis]
MTDSIVADQSGAPDGVVPADAGYGNDAAFRDAVGELELQCALGIVSAFHMGQQAERPAPTGRT